MATAALPKPKHARRTCKCGNPVSKYNVKKCRDCWEARGPDKAPVVLTGACGHTISSRRAKRCKPCSVEALNRTPAAPKSVTVSSPLEAAIMDALKGGPTSIEQITEKSKAASQGQALDALLS